MLNSITDLRLQDYCTGAAGVVIMAVAVVLAVTWIFLPFFLLSRLARLEKVLRQIETNTREKETRPEETAGK